MASLHVPQGLHGYFWSRQFLQYSVALAISAIRSDPAGTGYSNSIVAWNGHLLSRISCSTSLIGVSPSPNGTLGPLLSLRSLTCTCVMRSWYCLMNGTGDVLLPATKWPRSTFAK